MDKNIPFHSTKSAPKAEEIIEVPTSARKAFLIKSATYTK
jgi:hypothetical protein